MSSPTIDVPIPGAPGAPPSSPAGNVGGGGVKPNASSQPHIRQHLTSPSGSPGGAGPQPRPNPGGIPNNAQGTPFGGGNINQQQQAPSMNSKLTIDFAALMRNNSADASLFKTLPIGILLSSIGTLVQQECTDIKWHSSHGVWEATLGKAKIFFVTGMDSRESPIYKIPETVMRINPWVYSTYGHEFVREAISANVDEARLFIFEDDYEQCQQTLAYHIAKCAFPNMTFGEALTEDQYLGPQSGFQVVDTRAQPQMKQEISHFFNQNRISAMHIPASDAIALTISQRQFQSFGYNTNPFMNSGGIFGNNQMPAGGGGFGNPMMGGMPGMNTFDQGFGQNGGFGVNGFNQQSSTVILAALKYYITVNEYSGYKHQICHITDIIENRNIQAEGFMKHVIMYFVRMGYQISLDIDISKLSQNLKQQINTYFMMNMMDNVKFHNLVSYVHPESKVRGRYHPDYLSLKTFASIYPDIAKSDKFPKTLATAQDKERFEEFKAKAGYTQILSVGDIHMVLNSGSVNSMWEEYRTRMLAVYNNMTLNEFQEQWQQQQRAAQQNGQPGAQPQPQQQQNIFGAQPFNAGFGNPMFGGQQGGVFGSNPMMGGMQQQYGMFGMNPMYGMQQPGMNPMFGGFPGAQYNMMGGMPQNPYGMQGMGPMYGNSPHPGGKPGAKNKDPNQQQNIYAQNPYGMNPMYGGMPQNPYGMQQMGGMMPPQFNGGMGMPGAMPGYMPQQMMNPAMAGGAFPSPAAPGSEAGRYVPQ